MAKDDRLYARFDIGMDEHAKIMLLNDSAFRALIEATLYARRQRTDGFLAEGVVLKKWGKDVAPDLTTNHPERPSWVRVDGGWQIHDFEEHQTTNADIEAKKAAGRKGGMAKARNVASKPLAPATEVLGQKASTTPSSPLAITETDTETETNTTTQKLVQKPAHDYASEFAEWWATYPRKQGKSDALKAFTVIRKKVPLKTLMEGAQAYSLLNIGEEKSYLKLPAGWLRGERWEDEQIVNATKTTTTNQRAECELHPGYPKGDWMNPCDRCKRDQKEARDRQEGREF